MIAADIIALLQQQFGPAITGAKADALDPFVTVEPARLIEVCRFLRDDPRLRFAILNDITGQTCSFAEEIA